VVGVSKYKEMEMALNVLVDESGAKGYADNLENKTGEIGIIVSYFLEENTYENVKIQAKTIYLKYKNIGDGKLHITSLSPKLQSELRKEVYNLLIKNKINWSYQAIYTNGFYNENYKKSGYRSLKSHHHSMHIELLFGISIQSLNYAEVTKNKTIKILSDQLDENIIKGLYKRYGEFFNIYSSKPTKISKFNYETKKVEFLNLEIKINATQDEKKWLGNFSCDLTCDDNELTLIADVLSNSVLFHLENKITNNVGIKLNSPTHFEDHPLFNNLYMKNEMSFLDKVYSYKKV
jgi:hypothetical protein